MTDAELLARFVRERDQDALTQLVARYERLVWSVCSRTLTNRADREDAFQTTFFILVKKAHRIRKPSSLSNWLYGTAWKVASRIRKRRADYSLDAMHAEGTEVVDSQPSQLDVIARQHEIDLVDHHLQAMSERDRTPLILHYFAGMTAKEIAHQLHLTPAATEGRIRRARARLRSQLQREGIHYSSFAMLGMLGCCVPRAEITAITLEKCVAACAGSTAGFSIGNLSLGAKMMICKYVCAAGISAILAVGGLFHVDSSSTPATLVVDATVIQSSAPSNDLSLQDAVAMTDSEFECCPLMNGLVCCAEVCGAFHARMEAAHESLTVTTSDLRDFVASLVIH